jgi:hypothetical protein
MRFRVRCPRDQSDTQTFRTYHEEVEAVVHNEQNLSDWHALQYLTKRCWWARLWTIQGKRQPLTLHNCSRHLMLVCPL